jgi:phosphatidylserine decarboxylase
MIAMLVGSIGWSKKPGDTVTKGAEAGWFAYGGSTMIVVLPSRAVSGVKFDDDLIQTSEKGMETIVRVGNRIAVVE